MGLIGNSECADHGEVRIFCKIGVFYKWQEEKAEKESQAHRITGNVSGGGDRDCGHGGFHWRKPCWIYPSESGTEAGADGGC